MLEPLRDTYRNLEEVSHGNCHRTDPLHRQWTSGTNLATGIWLIAAPFIPGYSAVTAALWNDILIGLAVAGLAWTRMAKPLEREGSGWTNAILGVWLLAAPFALGYTATTAAMSNDIVIGLVVVILGVWSAVASRGRQASGNQQAMTS